MDNRNSEKYELNAIRTISDLIRKRSSTRCTLKDVITMKVEDVEQDKAISDAYNAMRSIMPFGSQYDWLARFSMGIDNLELNIHEGDKALKVISAFGKVIKAHNDEERDYFILDPEVSSAEARRVFGNFHFPLLKYSKIAMKKEADENDFGEIMDKTWFCYFPVNGQPCGACNPCVYTFDEGMGYRFNKAAIRRYRSRKNREYLRRVATTTGLIHAWRFIKSLRRSGAGLNDNS
jgi:7-cyano-7-deazaguanine synthase